MIYSKGITLRGGLYKIARRIPVVKTPTPKDYEKARLAIKYLRAGITVTIKGTKKTYEIAKHGEDDFGIPIMRKVEKLWYKTKGGYINEIALMGAEIERL